MIYAKIEVNQYQRGVPNMGTIEFLGDRGEAIVVRDMVWGRYKKKGKKFTTPTTTDFNHGGTIVRRETQKQIKIKEFYDGHSEWIADRFNVLLATAGFIPVSETFFYKP